MLWMVLFVAICGGCPVLTLPPPDPPLYAQSSQLFSQAKLYLLEKLPVRKLNLSLAEDRQLHAFAVAAVVVSDVRLKSGPPDLYGPLSSFERLLPLVWSDYTSYALSANKLVNKASQTVAPLQRVVDTECALAPTLRECNLRVDRVVKDQMDLYSKRAALLLELGQASELLLNLQENLESLKDNYELVPYLAKTLLQYGFRSLQKHLLQAYLLLKEVDN